MKQLEVERKTVDEAIRQGLEELGLSLEEVRIDVLEEGSKGLFGLIGVKNARVRLTVREEEQEIEDLLSAVTAKPAPVKPAVEGKPTAQARPAPVPARPAAEVKPAPAVQPVAKAAPAANVATASAQPAKPRPARPQPPRSQSARPATEAKRPLREEDQPARPRPPRRERDADTPLEEGEADVSIAFLTNVAHLMGAEVAIQPFEREGTLCLDIQGDEKGILIGHRGETLDALQYLTSLVHNKDRQLYRRLQLDAQNYRKKREETLVRLAERLADKARRSGHRVALEPMNPYERRILHSALQDHPHVTTRSEGDEPNRRVVILPKVQARGE